jgi:hypothetical protein
MKSLWAIAIVLVSVSVSGWAQQNNTLKYKKSPPEKLPKSTATGTLKGPTAASANAKDLQSIENQSTKLPASSKPVAKKTAAPALKPAQDKPNPPINFGGSSGSKQTGLINQGPNPYAGRLKQKGPQ